MSGALSGPDNSVVDNSFVYPYGTTEQFPQMEDSDLNVLTDSAHYYMECSNKGTCDRASGECLCYDGYDGVACQRASCPGYPNSCSGHGVCKSKKQLASADNQNVYKLWDQNVGMGCLCDKGYYGADCSLRQCKYGVDPLYLDDSATVKYSIYDVATLTTSSTIDFTDGTPLSGTGYWAIRFFDITGEDWLTKPIIQSATCAMVVAALEALPNNVIPSGYTQCTRTLKTNMPENRWQDYDAQHPKGSVHPYQISYNLTIWEANYLSTGLLGSDQDPRLENPTVMGTGVEHSSNTNLYATGNFAGTDTKALSGSIYRLKFYGNPGAIPQPQVEIYLDGKRPSLSSSGRVITKVWTDGQQGESNDYFGNHCDSVTVTIGFTGYGQYYLTGLTAAEKALLKNCLGSSDFDTSNNLETYNWDYGNKFYPHIIKLVRSATVYTDGGYYAAVYYKTGTALDNTPSPTSAQGAQGTFMLLNPFSPPDSFATDNYEVYTTTGTLALTSNRSEAVFSFASNLIYTVNASYDQSPQSILNFDGDISCEIGSNNAYKTQWVFHCLNKSDIFTFLSFNNPEVNPPHLNLYTAQRLYTKKFEYSVFDLFGTEGTDSHAKYEAHYMSHVITTDIATNWGATSAGQQQFNIYKFFPTTASTYNYVASCSNRGICDNSVGTCSCFPGYTNDDCSVQNSISL